MRMRKTLVKAIILFYFVSLVLAVLPQSPFTIPEAKAIGEGNIGFEQNVIPFVNVQYQDYSFVFSYKSFFIRIRPFVVLTNGSIVGMKVIVPWLKSRYPNVNWATLVKKLENQINYGFNLTRLPQAIANNVEAIGFKLVDLNFPLSYFELEQLRDDEHGWNITRINIPKVGLTFSFEDLYPYGYTVSHVNSTWVMIGNVKGKLDLNLDPIVYSSNTITVTGYTEGNPASFSSLWDADKAGERVLMASSSATTDMDLTTQIMPTDEDALKLRFVVTSYSVAGVINVTGTDKDGSAQTDLSIAVSANGNYSTTKWFKTVSTDGLDCSGTYSIAVYQLSWGVVWKQATNQYVFDCFIQVGDASTTTWFTDTAKEIIVNNAVFTAHSQYFIKVKRYATFTSGTLVDVTTKRSSSGCNFLSLSQTYQDFIVGGDHSGSVVYLYSSTFQSTAPTYPQIIYNYITRIWNCHFAKQAMIQTVNCDIYNVYVSGSTYVFSGSTNTVMDKIVASTARLIIGGGTVTNVVGYFTTNLAYLNNIAYDSYFINFDVNTWALTWAGTCAGKIYRQYEFDLTTTATATVTMKYTNGTQFYTATTNSSGMIPTQTVNRGHYQQSTGNTLNDYAPINITISKSGYQTDSALWTPTEKTKWQIGLLSLVKTNPVARFNNTITTVNPNQTVTLDGSMSNDPDGGTIDNYSWNFGDGNTTSGNYPTIIHSWITNDTYTISLTVTDDESATNSFSWEIAVTPTTTPTDNMPLGFAPGLFLGLLIMLPIGLLIWKRH